MPGLWFSKLFYPEALHILNLWHLCKYIKRLNIRRQGLLRRRYSVNWRYLCYVYKWCRLRSCRGPGQLAQASVHPS